MIWTSFMTDRIMDEIITQYKDYGKGKFGRLQLLCK